MAEMTVRDAVEILHISQYQKHMGDGRYEYYHTLTDSETKGIEFLLQRQAAEIERLQPKVCKKMCLNVTDKVTGVCSHEPYCRKAQDLMEKVERLQAEKELAKEAIAIVWAEKEKLKSKCESLQKGFDLNG